MRPLAECLQGRRLVVAMVGQLRSPGRAWTALRENLLDHCEHRVIVQCPSGDAVSAAGLYNTDSVDGWDPPAKLPAFVRWAWPVFGNSGRLATRTKPSFYFQLVRQARAARMFGQFISPERDIILKWRPDLTLLSPILISESALEGHVMLPEYENHSGFNDQCALGDWSAMRPYLTRLSQLSGYFGAAGIPHAESFLKWSLRDVKMTRMSICYAIDRGDRLNYVKASKGLGDDVSLETLAQMERLGIEVIRDAGDADHQWKLSGPAALWQKIISACARFENE